MATEFNYVARLDTSQIMSGLSEIRSQVGMALGSGGFGGGGFANTNFGGGAATGLNQMVSSFGGFGAGGGTHTDPAMAYSPHYGMQGAVTTLAQERLISGSGGMGYAARMAPPGVSAGEFAMAAMGNNADRAIQAREAAGMAGEAALVSMSGGVLADRLATPVGAAIGGFAGRAAATRMFGAGAGAGGAAVGGLVGGVGLGLLAFDQVSSGISDHYAQVNQTLGETREMGDIVGSGRGLTRTQQGELGIAARQAAGDIKMDMNQFGDVMALGRDAGMLPSTNDPGKFRQQGAEFANAVREVAQTLHSSLADATQVIKNASQKGLTVEEGMIRAAGGGPSGLGSMMYGMGAGVGRSMGFTGAQGGELFSGALGQAAGSGISGEESRILGGRTGVAALIGGTQLAAAASPMGTLQLMAAQGGQPLGSIMDLPGQALEAMSQGGDMLSNMGKFQVHGDEYRRGIGSKGVRAMAMQQLEGMGDMISDLMPGLSGNEAKRMAAMNMYGMSGTQAEAYVGGMGRGPGSGGDGGYSRNLAIANLTVGAQGDRLSAGLDSIPASKGPAEFGWGYAAEGAMAGMMLGPKGAAVGAVGGFIAGNARAIWDQGGAALENIGHIFDSSEEKADRRYRQANAAYDKTEAGIKDKIGWMNADPELVARGMSADLSGIPLSLKFQSSRALGMTNGALRMAGLTQVAAGPGTRQMSGSSWDIRDIQRLANNYGGKSLTSKQNASIDQAAYEAFFDPEAKNRLAATATPEQRAFFNSQDTDQKRYDVSVGHTLGQLSADIDTFAKGEAVDSTGYLAATGRFAGNLMSLTHGIKDKKTRERYQGLIKEGRFTSENDEVRAWAERSGLSLKPLETISAQSRMAIGAAIGETLKDREEIADEFLVSLGARPGSDPVKARQIARAARETDVYQRAMAPGTAENKRDELLRQAIQQGVVKTGSKNDDTFHIERMHARTRLPTAEAVAKRDTEFAQVDKYVGDLVKQGWTTQANAAREADEMKAAIADATPLGKDAVGTEAAIDGAKKKIGIRKRGPSTATNAIGFGEQESAMSAINKSLERTAKMIKSLSDDMKKPKPGAA